MIGAGTSTAGLALALARPDLAVEWHDTANGRLTPDDVTASSGARVWWRDRLGHEWQAVVRNRTYGTGCPFCANVAVWPGFNDLASQRPEIAAEWHPTANHELDPEHTARTSGKKVWWRCRLGHEWRMVVGNRTQLGQNCPICANQVVLAGYNDMATTAPALAAEWHPTRNHPLTPTQVFRSTAKKVWWQDSLGHEWQASSNERSGGSNCPYCSGQRILVGFNDLATRNPTLAVQWHPSRNGERTAQQVTVMNGTRAWWRCESGHEWDAVISSRSAGSGCPTCAGRNVIVGVNDLASQQPAVAATWHPTRNGAVRAHDVTVYSNTKRWFLCAAGHEWISTVNNRSHGQGCPECSEGGGFKAGRPGFVYFLEHVSLRAFKIGITDVDGSRLGAFQSQGWRVLHLERFEDGSHARAVESAIKCWWRTELRLPVWLGLQDMPLTGGWTETVCSDELSAHEVISRVRRESAASTRTDV